MANEDIETRLQALEDAIRSSTPFLPSDLGWDERSLSTERTFESMESWEPPIFFPPPDQQHGVAMIQLEDSSYDNGVEAGAPVSSTSFIAVGDGAAWSGTVNPDWDVIIETQPAILGRNAATHSEVDVGVSGYYQIGYSFTIDYPDGDTQHKQQILSRVVRNAGAGDVLLPSSNAWITDERRDAWQVGTTFIAALTGGDHIELQIARAIYDDDWALLTGIPQFWAMLLMPKA